jgi:hypothetical protein|tara:strand:- start:201 stop:338 length:138 start_codon:yes stop_codon:yes gene_type:complete
MGAAFKNEVITMKDSVPSYQYKDRVFEGIWSKNILVKGVEKKETT